MRKSYRRRIREARAARGRAWGLASARVMAARRQGRALDPDTLRRRALHDARGTVLREGCTFFGDGRVVPWSVRRSLRGRTDQLDVVVSGRLWRTAGPRRLPAEIRPAA